MVEEPDPASGEQGEPLSQGTPKDGSRRAVGGRWNLIQRKVQVPVAGLLGLGLALALLLIVIIALAARPGRQEHPPVQVLTCPYGWYWHRNVCYYISKEMGTWDWSREQCSSLGASLAVLRAEWEVDFLTSLKDDANCWLGLRRQDGRLEWVDGSSYNLSTQVLTQAPCLYLNHSVILSSSCSQDRPYICSKPLVGPLSRWDLVPAGDSHLGLL